MTRNQILLDILTSLGGSTTRTDRNGILEAIAVAYGAAGNLDDKTNTELLNAILEAITP